MDSQEQFHEYGDVTVSETHTFKYWDRSPRERLNNYWHRLILARHFGT